MNQMFDMYTNYADRYDTLIAHEDYPGNLSAFLHKNIEWKDSTVYEFGAGTGRCTQYYLEYVAKASIFDNSRAMLDAAQKKLANPKLKLTQLDNENLHTITKQVDIVIEGWSFGHLAVEKKDDIFACLQYLDDNVKRLAKKQVVLIETMGTNVNIPTVPNNQLKKMYSFLEEHGYTKNIVKTDYKFETYQEAAEIMGSFFGDEMKKDIQKKQLTIIPEYTGIWVFTHTTKSKTKSTKKKYLFNL